MSSTVVTSAGTVAGSTDACAVALVLAVWVVGAVALALLLAGVIALREHR
ncbi:hypothetical protein SAMN06264364_101453 [Quadrisphaera granulorum]|uniref:Uncharacterized protein n=1 Tax=Quadrisphaera granulorum TaxID=317664 RepID=A0A316AFB6_9ACTN|nr:hypothetical protein [Quadrisphaera granulorum]PWJ56475.1 hypothetical protein BXY45_101453 [Quadrisphaera granulorum]SZE95109.1 hypothetical protein SAMN06264364_101453 [Quadrisphaera granulorum]